MFATVVPALEAEVTASPTTSGAVEVPLLRATRTTLRRHGYPVDDDVGLSLRTTIPRSVGFAGSSAIVIAAIRALLADVGVPGPLDLARLALEVEVEGLGIAAGPQDRIVQVEGRTVLMDFATDDWIVTPIDPPEPLDLFVAWSTTPPTPSHAVHGPLQARSGDPLVRRAMARLSELAHTGARALRTGDLPGVRDAMDRSFEERAQILDLEPAHLALVEGARRCGAAVNYAGSGGAVVGHAPDDDAVAAWAAEAGHGFHRWTLSPRR